MTVFDWETEPAVLGTTAGAVLGLAAGAVLGLAAGAVLGLAAGAELGLTAGAAVLVLLGLPWSAPARPSADWALAAAFAAACSAEPPGACARACPELTRSPSTTTAKTVKVRLIDSFSFQVIA